MTPYYYETDYFEVSTTHGTWIVPSNVESSADNLASYVEGETLDIESKHGWVGRFSMPGYLDCTDWHACASEEAIKSDLAETYDLCPSCLADLDENDACTNCDPPMDHD